MTTTQEPPAEFFTGERLLRLVASAITRLASARQPATPVYEPTVLTAYNNLVLRCLKDGVAPPSSVPDMTAWAAELPLERWPLELPDGFAPQDEFLVDAATGSPTQQCLEWAVSAPDPAAELFENVLMHEAISACRISQSPESYTAFRALLVARPVLTGADLIELNREINLQPVLELIQRVYEPVTATYLRDGQAATCARCGCLLVSISRDGYRCELDRCHRAGAGTVGKVLSAASDGGLRQLSRPLRMFITGPGLAEGDLDTELQKRGLKAEMWPNFDAYDLRITLPSGKVWAVDVKDRSNPVLLGRGAKQLRPDPPYHRAFLVVPQYRFDEQESYGRVFKRNLAPDLATRLELLTDTEFLRRVDRELSSIPASSGAGASDA